ncbi:MAG: FtsX-like permease family protein [Planctomycetaceae bacterium]|nr:FtsX-like permease family protein [Planctomycetaceae bacterium]
MRWATQVPLAWKNLTHNTRRLATAIAGIMFAVILMFVEQGFENALLDSTVYVIEDLNADLVLYSPGKYLFEAPHRFDRRQLLQAETHPLVTRTYPFYVEVGQSSLKRVGHRSYPIRVLAFDVNRRLCNFKGVDQNAPLLQKPRTAIIDIKSKADAYKAVPLSDPQQLPEIRAELAGKQLQIVGTFSLGTDFANEGTMIMAPKNFARYFPYRDRGSDPLSQVDVGLIQIRKDADPAQVRDELVKFLPKHIEVKIKRDYVQNEKTFWSTSTPVGYIFRMGVVLGFVVGTVICYQIIFANINDHQSEFATLKAMGYPPRFFIQVVLGKSFYLSVLGFLPGWLVTWIIFWGLSSGTGLHMDLRYDRVAIIYLLTLGMCFLSGCFAIWKVLKLEPAELF